MISDSDIVARYNAVEARMGGFQDQYGNINAPKAFAEVAEALGIEQVRVANAMRAHWAGVGGG